MVTSNSLPVGTILKGLSYSYRIEKTLGQGSFGITYLASVKMAGALGSIDAKIRVAIKEFFMRDINGRSDTIVTSGSKDGIYDDYKRKFKREALNLSKLEHPNIIKVIESFEANNTVYYVMEYIGGGSLDDYIARNKGLEESEAIRIVKQIGSALSYMHSCKMLHLDLKPSNVMMKESGDVVLIDFGLSKQYDSQGNPEASTKVGAGTPGYAPIEQANYREGKGFPVTMDVYALGGTMFKMLTGERPPEASEILNEGFPKKDLALHNISRELIDCIEKAMWPTKKDRYQSINEFITIIKGVGNEKRAFKDASVKVLRVDDSDLKTEFDSIHNSQYQIESKRVKFIFKEGDKEIPNSLIAPILILPGRQIPLIDESYTFFGKEIYDEKKIISKSLDYRLKRGCEKIELSHVNDVYIIQVEHIFSFKISFAPYDKPKNVILSSSHGVFSNYDVRGVLVATLPGYIEDYSYAIESKYYEYQSGKLSSLLKYVRLTSRILTTPSTNNIDSRQRISPSNKNGIKNSPIRLSNYTPWILLGIGFVVAVLFLIGNGAIGCGRRIELAEVVDSDSVYIDFEMPDTAVDFFVNDVYFAMMSVEGGTFRMGATAELRSDADDDEQPVHSVTLSSYSIGQTEVTQALWQAVMGSNPSYNKGDNLPVEQVSWEDCQTFIAKLNQITGQKFRLPTEAEWEYAARDGKLSEGYKYSGSNTIAGVAWYADNSSDKTHPVATKQPNEQGLYDMSGNVDEWCQDWYGSYSNSAQSNPTGPSSGSYRVIRGGSCNSGAGGCRVSYRSGSTPSSTRADLGFRLALSAR